MRLVFALIALLVPGTGSAWAVGPGDTVEEVREEMGLPNGLVEIGSTRIEFFDRGEVVFRNGRVQETTLLSSEEYDEQVRLEAQRAELLARLAERRRLEREAEGLELKQSTLDNPTFLKRSAAEQLAFWRIFAQRYPMVPVELEIAAALSEVEADQLKASNQALARKVSELEARLVQAERNQYRSSGVIFPGFWGGSYYRGGRPPYRPPGHKPDKNGSDHNFHSTKGAIMSSMDRARGRYDSNYSTHRTAVYRSITP